MASHQNFFRKNTPDGMLRFSAFIVALLVSAPVAAVSCGISKGKSVLDLDYAEDSACDVDANFVMTGDGKLVEVQGTAERDPFAEEQLLAMLALARKGVTELVALQKKAVAAWTGAV